MIKPIKPSPCNPVLPTEYQEVLSYMEGVEKCAKGVNDLIDKTVITDNQINRIDDEIKSIDLEVSKIPAIELGVIGLDEELTRHKEDENNPHKVTKSQIGLGNVDNTSDLNKPISTATQTALDGKMDLLSFEDLEYYAVPRGMTVINFNADRNGNLFNLKAAYVIIASGEYEGSTQLAGHFFFDNGDDENSRIQFTMSNATTNSRGDFFGYKLGANLWLTGFDNFRPKSSTLIKYGVAAHYELPLLSGYHHITKIAISKKDGIPVGTRIKIYGIQDNSNN